MTSLSPRFFVLDTNAQTGSPELIHCPSQDARVKWPSSVPRGRPKKARHVTLHSSAGPRLPSDRPYEFVQCPRGKVPDDISTRKVVRMQVMRDHRQKNLATSTKNLQDYTKDRRRNAESESVLLQMPYNLRIDPFDHFPTFIRTDARRLLQLYVSAATQYLFPIEGYWGFNPAVSFWVPQALSDPVLMHSILFASDQFDAKMGGQNERPSAIKLLRVLIQALNERLKGPVARVSESTIAAVAGLAITEFSSGNQSNWRIHLNGIKEIVAGRGGLSTFRHNPYLLDKLCRADMCGSMHKLSRPYFADDILLSERSSVPAGIELNILLAPGFSAVHSYHNFNKDDIHIINNMCSLTMTINDDSRCLSNTLPTKWREVLRSIQYQLLSGLKLGEQDRNCFTACRVGILLYTGIIQNELWVSPVDQTFTKQLKFELKEQNFTTTSAYALRLWLVFLAAPLVHDELEQPYFLHCVLETARQLSLSTWSEARLLLSGFAWVGQAQDAAGRHLWEEATKM